MGSRFYIDVGEEGCEPKTRTFFDAPVAPVSSDHISRKEHLEQTRFLKGLISDAETSREDLRGRLSDALKRNHVLIDNNRILQERIASLTLENQKLEAKLETIRRELFPRDF
jgi:chromosome segregation ATPase